MSLIGFISIFVFFILFFMNVMFVMSATLNYKLTKYIQKNKTLFFLITLLTFLLLIQGVLIGYFSNKPDQLIIEDFMSGMSIYYLIITPFLLTRIKIKLKNVLVFFLIINIIAFLTILFFGRNSQLTIVSTVSIAVISLTHFFSLYLIKKNIYIKLSYLIYFFSYFTCLLTLSKWLVIVILLSPSYFLYDKFKYIFTKKQFLKFIFLTSSILIFIKYLLEKIIARSIGINNFENLNEFLASRVFSGFETNINIIENLINNDNIRILDGSRFPFWKDLILNQLNENPLLGIGYGSRALNGFVEDHNLFVFMFSRHGYLMAVLFIILISILFLRVIKINSNNKLNAAIILFFLNFLIQINTGMQWKAIPYIFVFSLFCSFMISLKHVKIK